MTTTAALHKAKLSSYQILAIVILALTQFTVVLDFMVMSPLGDLLMKSINLSTSQFGFAVSSYAFSAGISGLLTAGFADRFDRKKLLLFFYLGFIAGTAFCGMANSYPLLIAARIITGLFGGVIGSISMAIIADIFSLEQRGRVMGFIQMGFGASQVLGIPISLFLANVWGWQAPFWMIVLLALAIWFVIVIYFKPVNKHLELNVEKNAFQHLLKTITEKKYQAGFLSTALLSTGGFMIMPWSSAFVVNNLHITQEQLPSLFMFAGISSLIIMPIIGKLSDKFDKFTLFWIASILMMIIVFIYTNLQEISFVGLLIVNILMMMGIMSRMVSSMALTSALPNIHDRGAFMSISSSLQQIAGGIAAGVGGLIVFQKDKFSPIQNYDKLGWIVIFTSLVSIYMVWRVKKLVHKKQAPSPDLSA